MNAFIVIFELDNGVYRNNKTALVKADNKDEATEIVKNQFETNYDTIVNVKSVEDLNEVGDIIVF